MIELLIFGALALVAVGSALAMLLSRNTVHAALFLVLNFTTVSLLYLVIGAPFIALAQITVYAGAIMVLFLFVIMLLGTAKLPGAESLRAHRPIALLVSFIFLGELVMAVVYRSGIIAAPPAPSSAFTDPAAMGMELFRTYALPFEITSIILLAALIGAVLLTKKEPKA
ncbi:MAG TPA: NADH-quinone oxidoreductase subunit J [Longilinea sp.]|nr:NADH-quinone oxidoreductase subunit J [Longilinea sp.]